MLKSFIFSPLEFLLLFQLLNSNVFIPCITLFHSTNTYFIPHYNSHPEYFCLFNHNSFVFFFSAILKEFQPILNITFNPSSAQQKPQNLKKSTSRHCFIFIRRKKLIQIYLRPTIEKKAKLLKKKKCRRVK